MGDSEKSKNGKGIVPKKINRKIVKKQTDASGKFSMAIENAHPVPAKPKVQQKALRATKETVKKSIIQSAVKKLPVQKALAVTTELINRQKTPRLIKKRLVTKDPNSSDKTEPKRVKLIKRVPKAISTTTKTATNTTTAQMPKVSAAASHRLGGTNPTTAAKKQPVKRVKRVLRKKLGSSLKGKIAEPKAVDAMSIENVILTEKLQNH
ncbi:putative serine/threonine-protein kinase nek3 [Aphis craccivora]|uniref:Putative serine/threonine-protein kinase nek3 n=1 Tax=Aphis craccivora TaxID=307492 RepID=A0A6G0ZE92_APHCR|nr:putative serine/threonine-protein kinase nek3 [Aphis craccivora]